MSRRTHQNWTSSSSWDYTLSWCSWNGNSDSIHIGRRLKILGGFISRGANRCVEELHYSDPDCSTRKSWISSSIGRRETDHGEHGTWSIEISLSTEETHAPQPAIQSNLVNDQSEEFVPSEEKCGMTSCQWKLQMTYLGISNFGVKLVRHHDQEERKKLMVLVIGNRSVRNCGTHFREHLLWFGLPRAYFQREPKTGSNIARFLTTFWCIFALFQDTLEERDRAWTDGSWRFHRDGRNSCFTEGALLTWHHSTEHDSAQVERERKGDKQSSSHPSNLFWETVQKKNSTTTCRGREKYTIMANGSLIKTPSAGSTEPGYKRRDCSFGRQGSHAINDHDSVPADCIEQVVFQGQDKTWNQRLSTPEASSKHSSQEGLEIEATAATAAARYTKRQRETACGALPRQTNRHAKPKRYMETHCGRRAWFWGGPQNSKNPTRCSPWLIEEEWQ